jgi:hypothetical protein
VAISFDKCEIPSSICDLREIDNSNGLILH